MSHLSYLCLCCLIISDFQQKYVLLKAMRRSGGISKNLLIKKIEIKNVCFISNMSLFKNGNHSREETIGGNMESFNKVHDPTN